MYYDLHPRAAEPPVMAEAPTPPAVDAALQRALKAVGELTAECLNELPDTAKHAVLHALKRGGPLTTVVVLENNGAATVRTSVGEVVLYELAAQRKASTAH